MSPYEAYKTYLALKMHFTQKNYDFIKYNGKVKTDPSSFETRNDRFYFSKLAKKKDLKNYLIANLINNPNKWIGELLEEECEKKYFDYMSRRQALTYNFNNEITKLKENFNDNLLVKNGQYPSLLKMYRQGELSIETMIVLDDILNFSPYWNKSIDDMIIWPREYLTMVKYKPFLQYDKSKYKKILQQQFVS